VAIDAHTNSMGFGAIICDHTGKVCAARCERIQKVQEPVMGEAMAAMAAVEFCNSRAIQDVILEGDSIQVIQTLQEANFSWRKYGHFIDGIRDLLGPSRRWRLHHVKRTANRAADGLAKEGLRSIEKQTWIDESPECVRTIVSSEHFARNV
jgi:ribonuclease HI